MKSCENVSQFSDGFDKANSIPGDGAETFSQKPNDYDFLLTLLREVQGIVRGSLSVHAAPLHR